MSNNSQQQAGLIERLRLMELDHEPDSWPAIQMCDVSALLNELERRNYAGKMVAALPVGELTLEQITRIYDRYGGDMVNCTRAIERELAAARSQPTTEESLVVAGAQPVREPLTSEQHFAIREGHQIAAVDAYFSARPQIDSNDRRKVYEAGFQRGFDTAAHGITQGGKV